ncbi:MAG: DNA mismatch repair protein [Piccolia ochrophora]|nr:MAG: DNA mismatch repair protein [Piccolia ochrophora]
MARSNANLTIKRSQSSYENKQLRGRRKGVNKWPMFYLDFRCSVDTSQEVFSRDHLHENNDFINAALDLLRVTLTHFLAEHHFLPSVGKGKVTSRAGAEASLGTTNGMLAPFEGVGRANPREHSATKGSSQSLSGTKDFTCQEEKIRAKVHNQSSQNAITDGNIKIPSFYSPTYTDRSRSRLHMNTLSKVKSSNPHWAYESWDPSPLKSKLPSTIVRPHHGQEEVAKERPRAVSCFSGANIPSVSAQLDDTQIVGGNIIRGINPFTRAPFSLNSKTGFVVPQLVRRPYSAPSILENLSAAPTSGRASKRLWALKAGTKAEDSDTPPSWVEKLLEDWDNPCFGPSSTPIRRLSFLDSCSDLKSALHPNAIPDGFMKLGQHRLNKDQLKYAKVLAQVDRKFILVRTSAPNPQIQSEVPRKDLLILIDQHAADERCRVESLLSNMFLFTNDELRQKTNQIIVRTTTLEPPLSFQVVAQEVNLFADHRQRLAKWGIQYEIGEALPEGTRARPSRDTVVKVVGLPTAIAERCKSEPSSLLEMMRSEIWAVDHKPRDDQSSTENIPLSEHSWLRHIISCPSGILDLLNSRACRSAIMFNDKLSLDDCQRLVSRLYNCVFPFQCAHGRPSMIPLLEMESIEQTWDYSQGYEHPTASLSLSSTASGEVGVRKGFIEAFSTWQQA